jgi:hypothetical protein
VLAELERQASEELGLGGRLSAQEERDAQQAARAAWGARGLALTKPAAIAEVMNRDVYARERQEQRRTFAGGVSNVLEARYRDEAAQANQVALANQGAALSAAQGNQSAGAARWQTTATAEQEQARLRTQVALANQEADLRAQIANASTEAERARLQAQLTETVAARNQQAQLNMATTQAQLDNSTAARNLEAGVNVANANAARFAEARNRQDEQRLVSDISGVSQWSKSPAIPAKRMGGWMPSGARLQ